MAAGSGYGWRIGGAAVALGIGAAVATGLAAAASAAPSDSRADSVSAAESRAAVTRGPNAASPARRASATEPKPATAAPSASPASGPASPAAPRATAAKAARIVFPWDDPRGRLITIYKGTHFAIPNSFGLFVQKVAGTGTFTAETAYDLKDEDQYDWNKFTGIAFTPLEPDRDSVMVGWRYNLTSGAFEIAPFYNVNKVRVLPDERTEVISVPADQSFQFNVDYHGVTLTYGEETVYKPLPEGLIPNVWTAARVSGWFGGNEVAPRTLSYYLKLN